MCLWHTADTQRYIFLSLPNKKNLNTTIFIHFSNIISQFQASPSLEYSYNITYISTKSQDDLFWEPNIIIGNFAINIL